MLRHHTATRDAEKPISHVFPEGSVKIANLEP